MAKERRQHTRVPVRFEVFLRIKRRKIPVTTLNVSMRGMQCSAHELFLPGLACTAEFVLSAGVRFSVAATIMRTSRRATALQFTAMDEEAFFHLKRLVQFNTRNPDRIDRELAKYRP